MNPVSWDEYEIIDIKDDAIRNKYHQMLEKLVPIEYIVTILKYQWYGENEQPTDDVDEYFEFFLRDNRYFFHKWMRFWRILYWNLPKITPQK